MSIDYGNDYEYAHSRLSSSIVMCGGDLLSIISVKSDGSVVAYDVVNRQEIIVKLSDISTEPVPMGWVNYTDRCTYLNRMPARHYKQGFRGANTVMISDGRKRAWDLGREILMTVRGLYPNLDSCVETVYNEESTSKAFSRHFAVGEFGKKAKEMPLLYKAKQVGIVDSKSQKVQLSNKYMFLTESLEKCL